MTTPSIDPGPSTTPGSSTDPGTRGPGASRSPEDIESEIGGTRANVDRTLDALQSKLSPQRRLSAAADSARVKGERFMRNAADTLSPDITTMIRMDHTHVLALFRRFRPGISDNRRRALVANACLALEVHAQLEEEIFYPALREVAGPSATLDKSVPEHDEMRELVQGLRAMGPEDPDYDEKFRTLMRVVLHHVADEETTLLPQAEEMMGERLGELGMQMTRRRMELLKGHMGELASTTARSFPVAVGTVVASLLTLGWLALRPRKRMH